MLLKFKNIIIKRYLLLALFTFLVSSCGDDSIAPTATITNNSAQIAAKKAKEDAKKKADEEAKRIAQEEEDRKRNKKYNITKYNPFKTFIFETEVKDDTKKTGIKTPLECCDLSTFTVKMVVLSGKDSVAWIIGKGGKKYSVKKGTKIGINNGKVIKIHDNGITVKEYISAGTEGKVSVKKEMLLPSDKRK